MTLTPTSSLEETLNAYIADEYFAALQYRMAKVVAQGKALDYADSVFGDNKEDEDEHFDEIVTFAQSLKIPVKVNPEEMKVNCTVPYVDVVDGDTTAQLVSILIASEKAAIEGYTIGLSNESITKEYPELIQFLGEKLNDERTHLKELEDLESNIKADGKVVPQADTEEFDIISDDVITDEIDKLMSDDEEDSINTDVVSIETPVDIAVIDTNNDIQNSDENKTIEISTIPSDDYIDGIIITITSKPIDDVTKITKDFINYLPEQQISTFADYGEFFDPILASQTSQDNVNQCKCKFIEMIDDGTLDTVDVIKRLMKFVGKNDVMDFSNSIGLIVDNNPPYTGAGLPEEGTPMSFTKLFKSIVY